MKFDFKNILIGIIIGISGIIIIGFFMNDVHIEIQIGDKTKNGDILDEKK